jgi:hypothetical protein
MLASRVPVDAYVIDSLMPDLVGHDRRPSAFFVYLWLWRHTRGGTGKAVASLQMITDGTGLAKRSVQSGLEHLVRRKLVEAKRKGPTSAPAYAMVCHWR